MPCIVENVKKDDSKTITGLQIRRSERKTNERKWRRGKSHLGKRETKVIFFFSYEHSNSGISRACKQNRRKESRDSVFLAQVRIFLTKPRIFFPIEYFVSIHTHTCIRLDDKQCALENARTRAYEYTQIEPSRMQMQIPKERRKTGKRIYTDENNEEYDEKRRRRRRRKETKRTYSLRL